MICVSRTRWGPQALPFDLGVISMPGCDLLLSIDVLDGLLVAFAGRARWTLPVPDDLSLVGQRFFQQALVLDSTANAFGAVVSSAG